MQVGSTLRMEDYAKVEAIDSPNKPQGSRALQYRGEAPTFFEKLKSTTFEIGFWLPSRTSASGGGKTTLRSFRNARFLSAVVLPSNEKRKN